MNLLTLRKNIRKVSPYLLAIIGGLLLFLLNYYIPDDSLKSLVINMSAALIAIPLIFIVYELTQQIAHKEVYSALYDYTKMKMDKENMELVSQLMKIVYPFEQYELSPKALQEFLSLQEKGIAEKLALKKYVGFQIFKSWGQNEKNIEEILRNPFFLKALNDAKANIIVETLKSVALFDHLSQNTNIFVESGEELQNHRIVSGKEMNPKNEIFPDRYLLLEDLGKGKYRVRDYGDFKVGDMDKLLKLYSIESQFIEPLASDIFKLVQVINKWFVLTGNEFIFDPRFLRIRPRKKVHDIPTD